MFCGNCSQLHSRVQIITLPLIHHTSCQSSFRTNYVISTNPLSCKSGENFLFPWWLELLPWLLTVLSSFFRFPKHDNALVTMAITWSYSQNSLFLLCNMFTEWFLYFCLSVVLFVETWNLYLWMKIAIMRDTERGIGKRGMWGGSSVCRYATSCSKLKK